MIKKYWDLAWLKLFGEKAEEKEIPASKPKPIRKTRAVTKRRIRNKIAGKSRRINRMAQDRA